MGANYKTEDPGDVAVWSSAYVDGYSLDAYVKGNKVASATAAASIGSLAAQGNVLAQKMAIDVKYGRNGKWDTAKLWLANQVPAPDFANPKAAAKAGAGAGGPKQWTKNEFKDGKWQQVPTDAPSQPPAGDDAPAPNTDAPKTPSGKKKPEVKKKASGNPHGKGAPGTQKPFKGKHKKSGPSGAPPPADTPPAGGSGGGGGGGGSGSGSGGGGGDTSWDWSGAGGKPKGAGPCGCTGDPDCACDDGKTAPAKLDPVKVAGRTIGAALGNAALFGIGAAILGRDWKVGALVGATLGAAGNLAWELAGGPAALEAALADAKAMPAAAKG